MSNKKTVITLSLHKESIDVIKDANKQLKEIAKALHAVGAGMKAALKKGFKSTSNE